MWKEEVSDVAELKYRHTAPSGQMISLFQGDLTEEDVDAIVNAANERLLHGGGLAGAIVARGGQVIQEESKRVAPVPTGQAAITGAGKLKARWVIHAVGPVYRADDPRMDELLRSAVWNSLMLAHQRGLKSIAFPAISSGIFGFPKKPCAANLISTVLDFTAQYPDSTLRDIRFTIIDSPTVNVFLQEFKEKFNQSG
ncbi:MAG: macro domain-containing protein [Syntrophomonadaceae bacterium]|nr:macro domain-containing protein [Syntrophomonadaceae bacterium]